MLRISSFIFRCALIILLVPSFLNNSHVSQGQDELYATRQAADLIQQQSSPSETDKINRATSQPYKGDLSIFENSDRAERLQI